MIQKYKSSLGTIYTKITCEETGVISWSIKGDSVVEPDEKLKQLKIDCYAFDLDHTLFDNSPRDCLVPKLPLSTHDWTTWNQSCAADLPIDANIAIAQALSEAGYTIVYITSRCEDGRAESEDKLLSHDCPVGELFMRQVNENKCTSDVKVRLFERVNMTHNIIGAFDDDQMVVRILSKLGYHMIKVGN